MRDFLDNLIERHVDMAPQIKPRLPSMFEREVSYEGLEDAVQDDPAPEIEETDSRVPRVRMKETAPSDAEATGPPSSARVTHSSTFPLVVEAAQRIAVPSPALLATQGNPSIDTGPNGPGLPVGPRERGPDAGVPKSSVATQAAPVRSRVHYAHQEERTNFTSTTTRVDEQASVEEPLKPVFSVTPRERAGVKAAPSESDPLMTSDPLTSLTLALSEGDRGLDQGLLRPSTTSISPVYPSVTRTESPAGRPEPVINVSIGRIEVRATMSPQKQAPRPEIRTPVMGLEEYLRRRSGGGQDR